MQHHELVLFLLGFGAIGVFGLAVFEKLIPIIPSYLFLIILGSSATNWREVITALVATSAGSIAGTLCHYIIGWSLGERRIAAFVHRFGKYIFLPEERYTHLARLFSRNHFRIALVGQLVPVVRLYLAVPAGVLGIRMEQFLLASLFGVVLYNSVFLCFGRALSHISNDPIKLGLILTGTLLVIECLVMLLMRRRSLRARSQF